MGSVTPSDIISAVFSNDGLRGPWEEEKIQDKPTGRMQKCLAGGSTGLMAYRHQVNSFLVSCGLPEAALYEYEVEGFTKKVLIIQMDQIEWQQKIKPITDLFSKASIALGK